MKSILMKQSQRSRTYQSGIWRERRSQITAFALSLGPLAPDRCRSSAGGGDEVKGFVNTALENAPLPLVVATKNHHI